MMCKTQFLVGLELEKAAEACAMLAEFEGEEANLLSKINQANQNFLTIVVGHVGQLHSVPSPSPVYLSMPDVPPGISNVIHTDVTRVPSDDPPHSKRSDN